MKKIPIPYPLKVLTEQNGSELWLVRLHVKLALKALKKWEKQNWTEDKGSTINISTAGESLSALGKKKGALIPSL